MRDSTLSLMFMLRPAADFEILRADEIVSVIKIDLDLFLSIVLRQKFFRLIDQRLVSAGSLFTQFYEGHDHPGLDLLQDLGRTARINLPELRLDLLFGRFRPLFTRLDIPVGEFRLPPDLRVLMSGE